MGISERPIRGLVWHEEILAVAELLCATKITGIRGANNRFPGQQDWKNPRHGGYSPEIAGE